MYNINGRGNKEVSHCMLFTCSGAAAASIIHFCAIYKLNYLHACPKKPINHKQVKQNRAKKDAACRVIMSKKEEKGNM